MNRIAAIRKKLWTPRQYEPPPLGTRETLAHWLSEDLDGNDSGAPMIDLLGYGKLLEVLPDKIVTEGGSRLRGASVLGDR